jgi:ribonuclease D
MMTLSLPAPIIVASSVALRDLVRRLQGEPLVAVDTESNSLFAYHERVCLIQLSNRSQDWLIDPLALDDLSPLGPLFADSRIEKVFHAAEYDLICMKRDYGFVFNNLFDTMVASRIIGLKAFGLGALLETYFGIQVDKRFQRADWSIRPIPMEQLRYAQQDTHYLPQLRDLLLEQLCLQGDEDEAREVFIQMAEIPASERSFDADGYWRIHAAREFTRRQMAVLRELYLLREQIAERRDRPPFKVFTDEVMVAIVKAEPQTLKDLAAVPGMSHGQLERYGSKLLQAVQHGETINPPTRPDRTPRADAATLARFDVLHEWRKARAAKRGVESDVIIPKETMWALARSVPRSAGELAEIPGLGPWKREKYGEELLGLLNSAAEQDV